MRALPRPLRHPQSGLTLVELLLALAIGLILISGVVGVLVSGQQGQRLQQAYEELQSNGRQAISFLSQELRRAAYDNNGSLNQAALSDPSTGVFKLAYSSMLDCGGATGNVTVVYGLSSNELTCDGDQDPVQAMTSDVEALAARFGEDTGSSSDADDGLFDGNVDLYRTAAQVSNWTRVYAVQLALVLRSQEVVLDAASSDTYLLFPGVDVYDPSDDRYLRRVFRSTVYLRNRE